MPDPATRPPLSEPPARPQRPPGRPALPESERRRHIKPRVHPLTIERLERICRERKLSMGQAIDWAVQEAVGGFEG